MLRSNVPDHNQGFTLLEGLLVLVIVGILAAMTGPSYFAWSQRRTVDSAITNIEGAIKEAQRQAVAQAQTCTLTFNSTTITSSPTKCLITGDRTLSGVTLTASTTSVEFNSLGENTTSENTLVVTPAANPSSNNFRRCLVLSAPLGLVGTGKYNGSSCVP